MTPTEAAALRPGQEVWVEDYIRGGVHRCRIHSLSNGNCHLYLVADKGYCCESRSEFAFHTEAEARRVLAGALAARIKCSELKANELRVAIAANAARLRELEG